MEQPLEKKNRKNAQLYPIQHLLNDNEIYGVFGAWKKILFCVKVDRRCVTLHPKIYEVRWEWKSHDFQRFSHKRVINVPVSDALKKRDVKEGKLCERNVKIRLRHNLLRHTHMCWVSMILILLSKLCPYSTICRD